MDFISVASVYPTMKSATNPYMFSVGGTNVTGTSGQNIDDLLRNTRLVCLLPFLCNYRVLVLKGLGIQLRTDKNMSNQNKHTIFSSYLHR